MSGTCFENPIVRDGVSQQQRLVKALLPEYVAVDERKLEDLKQFVADFAKEIRFFDLAGQTSGNWVDFFNKKITDDQKTEPHFALFQAFLELFSIAQSDLNTLTRRHLDFYYKDVLRLKENPPVPDQVFIILELAKHVSEQGRLIAEGTRLKAGKDDLGNNVLYATSQDIVVNKATVAEIKNLYKDPATGVLHQSDIANSADGQGGEIESDSGSWLPFGDSERPAADIGFAMASPVLNLAEGTRTVTFKMQFKEITENLLAALEKLGPEVFNNAFSVYFSGEEEWIGPSALEDVSPEEINEIAQKRAVAFLNECETWQQIAGSEPQKGPVYDSPFSGYGDQIGDYDIGERVAINILEEREKLPGKVFTNLEEVRAVKGVGVDKINDLVYSFRDTFNSITVDVEHKTITVIRTLGKEQPAVVPYNQEVLLDPFDTSQPVAKVVLNTGPAYPYLYNDLIDLRLEQLEISVDVSEVTGLVVQNDRTVMDPSKTILPFGIIPVLGSTFYIGNSEVFQKNLTSLDINLKWYGLPEAQSFEKYYEYYNLDELNNSVDVRTNTSFTTNVSILDKRAWSSLLEDETLFEADEDDYVVASKTISIAGQALSVVPRDAELGPSESYSTDTQKGFIKLELAGTDFGHQQYQMAFTNQVLKNINDLTKAIVPNQPYNPTLKSVSIDYRSTVVFDLSGSKGADVEQYFHLHPFGASERNLSGSETESIYFLPQFRNEGEIYIGFKNLAPPQNLSILMQILEGSEDPKIARPEVTWAYLSDNDWVVFNSFDVLSDTSNGLLTSGILNFSVSKTATKDNTVITTGFHWLRASVSEGTGAIPDFVNAISQAVLADFQDNNNDPEYLAEALAAETIAKLEFSDSAIKSIAQPFASFGGQVQEESNAFYTRVSERLRHKQRAITIWDYERLVLQEFPFVYKVKCLNHTRYTGSLDDFNQLLPGHVSIIVVSNVQNKNAVDPIQPLTSLNRLEEIKAFIDNYRTGPITVHVQNPEYEIIRVAFKVRFHSGYDKGYYQRQLEDEIKAFLSPWAYSNSPDITFGGKVHQSKIIDFIDEREYVDYVTCFKMYHPAASAQPVTEAVASTSASILCSIGYISTYGDHTITVLEEEDNCDACDDNLIDPPPVVLSADSCCEETSTPANGTDGPYSYSVPDMDPCPEPDTTDLCGDTPGPDNTESLKCILVESPHHNHPKHFGNGPSKVYLQKANYTYIVPVYAKNSLLKRVTEVLSEHSIQIKGDLTHYEGHCLENLWNLSGNPGPYIIWKWPSGKRPHFDGTHTRLTFTSQHKIEEGDKVNLFSTSAGKLNSVYLPRVTESMVENNARIRVQAVASAGHELHVRRADHHGDKDRLQLKGMENDTSSQIDLQSVGGLYSIELQAAAFDPKSGYSNYGWKVTMENENYFKGCYAKNLSDDES